VNILKKVGDYYYERFDYKKAAVQYVEYLKFNAARGKTPEYAILLSHTIKAVKRLI